MGMTRRAEISDTLRQRVLDALHFQRLAAGSRLPSARTLAAELGADTRVILAAYRSLEREGVVERRPPSRAFFVAADAEGGETLVPTAEWLVDVLAGSLARGLRVPDFAEHARRSVETLRLRAGCIECNTDQLVWLARELQEDFGIAPTTFELETLRRDDELPSALRSMDLLLTSASHEEEVRPVAERLGRPLIVASWRRDLMAELTRLLAEGPVYFLGTDPRFVDKVRRLFDAAADASNVRPVILGRDDIGGIPAGSPVWVMRTARDALGGMPPHLHALSTLRAFAVETQRAILRFVVQANLGALARRPTASLRDTGAIS